MPQIIAHVHDDEPCKPCPLDHDDPTCVHGYRTKQVWVDGDDYTTRYTTRPTHLRIYREETGDEFVWFVDGADNEGRYTEDVRQFETFAECYAGADLIVADTEAEGVVWEWDSQRKTSIRVR